MKQSQSQSQSQPKQVLTTNTNTNIFVYGSLRSDLREDQFSRAEDAWRKFNPTITPAAIPGKLFWFRNFPGILLPSDKFIFPTDIVRGQLLQFTEDQMEQVLRVMDEIEGYYDGAPKQQNLFTRSLQGVYVLDKFVRLNYPQDLTQAWVYTLNLIPIGSDYAAMKLD